VLTLGLAWLAWPVDGPHTQQLPSTVAGTHRRQTDIPARGPAYASSYVMRSSRASGHGRSGRVGRSRRAVLAI